MKRRMWKESGIKWKNSLVVISVDGEWKIWWLEEEFIELEYSSNGSWETRWWMMMRWVVRGLTMVRSRRLRASWQEKNLLLGQFTRSSRVLLRCACSLAPPECPPNTHTHLRLASRVGGTPSHQQNISVESLLARPRSFSECNTRTPVHVLASSSSTSSSYAPSSHPSFIRFSTMGGDQNLERRNVELPIYFEILNCEYCTERILSQFLLHLVR